jgi:hypothetical protein
MIITFLKHCAAFFLIIIASATAAVGQDLSPRLISKVPKHLPLKIAIADGGGENVLNDLSIKVTNSGEKPIYYLKFFVSTLEDFRSPNGRQYVFPLKYGRNELVTFTEKATTADIPLNLNESVTFNVNRNEIRNFNETLKQNFRAAPARYQLEFQFLSFGDGTGFWGDKGSAFPSKKQELSLLSNFIDHGENQVFFALHRTSSEVQSEVERDQ